MPSLPHDIFFEAFYAHQEPASERTRRVPVVRLRTSPFPRAGVLFAARSLAEQRVHPYWIARRPQLDRHFRSLSFRPHPAILGSGIVSAARVYGHDGSALVPLASGADSDRKNSGRNLAAYVRAGAACHSSGAPALDERDSD